MTTNKFSFELNLRTISLVSFAGKLWEHPNIKIKIKNYFLSTGPGFYKNFNPIDLRFYKKWGEISKNLLRGANSLGLPSSVLTELQKTICGMGERIHNWICYLTRVLELDYVFAEKIFWTWNGEIDEIKIFNQYWANLDESRGRSGRFNQSPIFSMASVYAQINFIQKHRKEMIEELCMENSTEIINIMCSSIRATVHNWTKYNITDPITIRLCLRANYSEAFKYFWNKSEEAQRNSDILDFAKIALNNDTDIHLKDINIFRSEKRCEILLFLINQMKQEERMTFLYDNAGKILKTFLPIWQYQGFILEFFDFNTDFILPDELSNFVMNFKLKQEETWGSSADFRALRIIWEKLSDSKKIDSAVFNITKLSLNKKSK